MKVGDRVSMKDVWKYDYAAGEIEKITSDYVVVKWDEIPGHWHYTKEQAQRLELINENDG